MNVIIAGSRWIGASAPGKAREKVLEEQRKIQEAIYLGMEMFNVTPEEITVIVGRAKGVDTFGEAWADVVRAKKKPMPADWESYGNAAGPIRNQEMAEAAGPSGGLILIWDGESKGSKHMLCAARKKGMRIFEWLIPKKESEWNAQE